MSSKLTRLSQQLTSSQIQARTKQSTQWLLQRIAEIRNPSYIARGIKGETYRESEGVKLGGLYCFYYDPKTKADLPYWDKFPLTLVLEKYSDGFLALNTHYLPIRYRVAFLDKLMDHAITKGDDIMKMRVTYDILATSKRYKEFKPCLKRYLYSHLQSKILTVQPNEWEVAVFLPMHQFVGEKSQKVWQESINSLRD